MRTIEDTIRVVVREEVRAALDEVRSALAELRPAPVPDTMLTVEQVAQRVGGVSPETVRDWIRRGKLAGRRAGKRLLVAPQALEAFLAGVVSEEKVELGEDEHMALLIDRIGSKRPAR
jgi:excisionase family DNA binding protein